MSRRLCSGANGSQSRVNSTARVSPTSVLSIGWYSYILHSWSHCGTQSLLNLSRVQQQVSRIAFMEEVQRIGECRREHLRLPRKVFRFETTDGLNCTPILCILRLEALHRRERGASSILLACSRLSQIAIVNLACFTARQEQHRNGEHKVV